MMKHKLLMLCILLLSAGMLGAQTVPTFSTETSETWYYVQWQRSGLVLQDMGETANVNLKAADVSNTAQQWKLVGQKDNFELVSKSGRHLYYSGTSRGDSYRFKSSASKTGGLKLHATTTKYAPSWEIQVRSISGSSMNQWGGNGGTEIGLWDQNEEGNPLLFVTAEDLKRVDVLPAVLKEYSVKSVTSYKPANNMTLWYDQPVTTQTCGDIWMDYALPIGNGQLGAMIYGGIRQDIVQFNDKTLWEGSSTQRGAYQTFGNLYIEELGTQMAKGVSQYHRQLDMTTAVASAQWNDADGVTYTREYIASEPDQCVVVHLKASQSGKLSERFYLYNAHEVKAKYADGGGTFAGKLTTLSYNANFKVIAKGGETTTDENGVTVRNADEIMVVLSAGTDYSATASGYVSGTAKLASKIAGYVTAASAKSWEELLETHTKDYKNLFDRCSIDLGGVTNNVPTNRLVDTYKTTATKNSKRILEQLYFQYGRYLLIASSRGVDLPNNLQGIWNNRNNPPWDCDMHANINVQMNYWAAEKTNLSELHDKYLNYLYNMSQVQPQWRSYARDRAGQSTGWINFTENNIFGHSTYWHNDYVEAGAWSCDHLWQHYRYTQDKTFLQQTALPVMLSSVKFWMERLKKDSDGKWICPGEWSPEHGPENTITAHAQQIVWALFAHTLEAIDILGDASGVTAKLANDIRAKFENLDDGLYLETYQGTWGDERNGVKKGDKVLKEWKYVDLASGNGGESDHRHLSHLMAMYPLNTINIGNPYYDGAIRSLELRGLRSQGWSMGWKMNLWARAQNPDMCFDIFELAFRHSPDYDINMSSSAGGVYYNLLDSHSPFQIDGNFGVCAGMAEMMLQNVGDTILLLPAIPKDWATGSAQGLKAEGNFTISQYWKDCLLQSATITSGSGVTCFLKNENLGHISLKDSKGEKVTYHRNGYNSIYFETTVGETYTLEVVEPEMIPAPGRERVNINRGWKFNLGDVNGAEQSSYNEQSWSDVNLPHSFSIPYFMWYDVYHGYGWYRKTITVDEQWKNKQIGIEFEGSFIDTEVYLNGRRIGEHVGGYTSFTFDLTPYLVEGENVLAVRVNNLWNARVAPRAGDHQFSGGIYRDVWLNVTDHLRVSENGTFVYSKNVSKSQADVYVEAELRNDFHEAHTVDVETTIYDAMGVQVAQTTTPNVSVSAGKSLIVKQQLPTITTPALWSPESPTRYRAVTRLLAEGVEVDSYSTRFGIRKMEWTADKGFFLNGEHYYLLGANVHQDQAGWGDAVTNGAMARDVQMMKDCGFNCIRGSHYPHDPAFAEACDSIGVILFMETMFWGMGGNGDEGAWGEGAPASAYPTVTADQKPFERNVLDQLKEEIRVHRNSPSIACWSLSNEPFFCSSSVDDKMRNLLRLEIDSARVWDPSREVAVGGAQRKDIDKLGKGAIAFYNGDGASRSENRNPGVPNLVSEYGSTTDDRPGRFEPGWGDLNNGYDRPAWRSGQAIWCGFDHGTVGGYGLAKMGLVDYFRLPKRNYYWYVEAYKKGKTNPSEPEWPKSGTPAKLKLTASQTVIPTCDGTDDAQIIVTIQDSKGKHISNSLPVTLRIISGPGEFPTGRSITFTPPTVSNCKEVSKDEKTDIRIMDGQAAIAMRAYAAGETVIEASCGDLTKDRITITSLGTPLWQEGIDQPVEDRYYKRYDSNSVITAESINTLADQRPAWASSERSRLFSKSNANDGNLNNSWRPAKEDEERWWMVCLEAQYTVNRIELFFPTEENYQYTIEVAKVENEWTKVVDQTENSQTSKHRVAVGNFGEDISYVRVRFTSSLAALSEIRVCGSRKPNTLDDDFLGGTIIGTNGSWDNADDCEKFAAMDFDGATFFNGPSSADSYWVGLDLGYNMAANVTKVAYMPRFNSDDDTYAKRMVSGKFQVANDINFTDPVTIYTVKSAPKYKEFTTKNTTDATATGRYVRYLGTKSSYGNVAELQFYGNYVDLPAPDAITGTHSDERMVTFAVVDRHIRILGASHSAPVTITDLAGRLYYQGTSHDIILPHYGVFIARVGEVTHKLEVKH